MRRISSLALVLLLTACGNSDKKDVPVTTGGGPAKQPPLAVEAYIVNPRSLSNQIEVPGSILAFESTEIHPEMSGRVVQLNVKEGTVVSKGTLLAKLYDGDLQATLNKLQVQLSIAQANENRSSQLLKIQGISQQDYDMTLLSVNNIKADIEITKANISKTVILAPFSGKLGLKNISPGAFVTPSTVIATIGQVNQLKLQFTVPEKYGAQIKTGQDIEFVIDGSNKTFHANVSATEVGIEENTRSLSVRSVIKGSDPLLLPGAFATVQIILNKDNNAFMIPTGAITPQGRKKIIYLFHGGKALSTEITTGVRDSSNVEVLTGLNKGDTVITTGILFLKPNADVKLTKTN